MLKKLVKETAVYGSVNIFFSLVAFVTFPAFARILSVEDYGVLSLVETISGFAGMFLTLGINNSVQRYYFDSEIGAERQRLLLSTAFWGISVTSVLIILICGTLVYPFNRYLFETHGIRLSYIYLALTALIPATCLNYFADVFRLKFDPKRFAIVTFFQKLFGVILGLFFVMILRRGLLGNFQGLLLGTLLGFAVSIVYVRNDLRLEFDKEIFIKLLMFGFPFIFANLSMWFFSATTRWMLANILSVQQSGLYAVAFKISTIMSLLNTAIGMAWAPIVFKLFGEDSEYRLKIVRIFDVLFFCFTVTGAFICMFSHELLCLLTPPAYWEAANPAVMLTMSVVFAMTQQVTALGISFEKKSRLISFGWGGIAILNVALNMIFIPRLFATGGALSVLLCNLLLSAFYLYCTQKLHPFPFKYFKIVWNVASIAIIISISVILNKTNWTIVLIPVKLFVVTVFCLLSVKFGVFDVNQFKSLKLNGWRQFKI